MKAIVYTSQMVASGNVSKTLADIIATSQNNNEKVGVTGGLISQSGRVLQALEGPDEVVDSLFSKIRIDERHENIDVLCNEKTYSRHFPDWSMQSVHVADESMFNEQTLENIYTLFKKHMHYNGELFFELLRSTLADAGKVRDINATR